LLQSEPDRARIAAVGGDGKIALDRSDEARRIAGLEYAADAPAGETFAVDLDPHPRIAVEAAHRIGQRLRAEDDAAVQPGRRRLQVGVGIDRGAPIATD